MLFVFCFQVVALKKAIRELEQKVQDQEEELDDQAGQIQMLEQVDFQCFKFSLQIGKSVSRIFTLRHSQRTQGDYLVPCQVSAGKKTGFCEEHGTFWLEKLGSTFWRENGRRRGTLRQTKSGNTTHFSGKTWSRERSSQIAGRKKYFP